LKVLQVYKDFYPPVKGGIEKHINLLSNGLRASGIQVEILVSNTRPKMEREYIDGMWVFKVPQLGRISSAPINWTLPFWIRKFGESADILHFHFPNPTAELSYLVSGLKKQFVITYHSDIIRQVYLKKLYRPFQNQFLRRAAKIIVTSPRYLETSVDLRKFASKCEIIPFGIDLRKFVRCDIVEAASYNVRKDYGTPLVLFVGKFRYYKGVHVLIQAMKEVRAKLLLVGPELECDSLLQEIENAGVKNKVVVIGELSDEELTNYFYACDVFVLPSIKRSEAFGIVQLEAMACGKPVVCTELGTGTSFVNRHMKTGVVVPPNDPRALAEGLNLLLSNEGIREQYGSDAIARVRDSFSLKEMVNRTTCLYRQVLGL
jgi:glycosyltransferase involved in cell wall biosynthesis